MAKAVKIDAGVSQKIVDAVSGHVTERLESDLYNARKGYIGDNKFNGAIKGAREKAVKAGEDFFQRLKPSEQKLLTEGGEGAEAIAKRMESVVGKAFHREASFQFGKAGVLVDAYVRAPAQSAIGAFERTFLGKGGAGPNAYQKFAAKIPTTASQIMRGPGGVLLVIGGSLAAVAGVSALWRGHQEQRAAEDQQMTQLALQQQMMQAQAPVSYKNSVSPYESALLDERLRAGGNGGSMGDKVLADRAAAQASNAPVGSV